MTDGAKRMNLQQRLSPGRLFDREPVMFMAVVQTGVALAIAFGLNLTGDQVGTIMAFTGAVLALVVRQNVTPTPPMQSQAGPSAPSKLVALALAVVVLTGAACAGRRAPDYLSSEGVKMWAANEMVLTLGSVQRTAIGLNKIQKCTEAPPVTCAPLLSDGNTRVVIDNVATAVRTIEQTPAGWRPAATTALAEIQRRLDASGRAELAAWLTLATTVMQEIR